MNKGELVKILEQYPDDMEVAIRFCSDYGRVGVVEVIQVVSKPEYLMSFISKNDTYMSEEDINNIIDVIHLKVEHT